MEYFVAKDENGLHPDWFSTPKDGRFSDIRVEEYLKTKDARRNEVKIVVCEIIEIATK